MQMEISSLILVSLDPRVNRLMTDTRNAFQTQSPADLLRTPVQLQFFGYVRSQLSHDLRLSSSRASPRFADFLALHGSVTVIDEIATLAGGAPRVFTPDGRDVTTQVVRYLLLALSFGIQNLDVYSIPEGQLSVLSHVSPFDVVIKSLTEFR
jgi:hypothetical protein